jgi:hypothetical protein
MTEACTRDGLRYNVRAKEGQPMKTVLINVSRDVRVGKVIL